MFRIITPDLSEHNHARALIELLNIYAIDPMGGGKNLPDYVKQNLVANLLARSDTHVIFALDGEEPIGMIICMEGFSTFSCKPLINIHDVIVKPAYRGKGISAMMFERIEQIAREKGCCKLTLEVLTGNRSAKSAYAKYGFEGYQLDPQMGEALFWQKKLVY